MDRKIDVHAHFVPNFYRDVLHEHGLFKPDDMPAIPHWSEDEALRTMERLAVDLAIVSISSPGVFLGDAARAPDLAAQVNAFAQQLEERHPSRFAWFAATPLPDVSAAITEATRAIDEMGAQGIVVETNHDGMYLGDPRLGDFYAALNEREAILFIHPTSPSCQGCGSLALGLPHPMLEFMFDTTRTVTDLVLSGTTKRFPEIRFIVPHAGAALSVLASRVDMLAAALKEDKPLVREELKRFYYDLAGAPLPDVLPALLRIVDPSRILYGSDWPFTPTETCVELAKRIVAIADERASNEAFLKRNALGLFPNLCPQRHARND